MKKETDILLNEMAEIREVFIKLLTILPSFDITSREVLPYGLKPHTRSVAWIVEQVIVQQSKYRAEKLGISSVHFDLPDTCLHDVEITIDGKVFFINVKIHKMDGKENKNDISAVEKLYFQYHTNPKYNLIYACFGIHFDNVKISFDPDYLTIFSPQFMPIYVNPRNDKLQATYHHKETIRSRQEFLTLLKQTSKSIIL